MAERTVLMVGLGNEQVAGIPVPEGTRVTRVASDQEALDQLALDPPHLIIANDVIGELDSLDFFRRVIGADPESATPVIFLAAAGSGVEPFLYQRRRAGFEVRYLDREGALQTFFVAEPTTDKAFTVRSLRSERVGEEISRFLGGDSDAADLAWDELGDRLLELGFNQDVEVAGTRYHVQTEVVAAEPVTVSIVVFCAGRTVHTSQQKVKQARPSLAGVRLQVEALHAEAVARVSKERPRMTKQGLFGWLKGESRPRPTDNRVRATLQARGVNPEALDRAARHRHLLQTRLVSTLVEMGEVDESAGLEVLCGVLGQPGVCLARSVIDLTLRPVPSTATTESLLLPVQRDPRGNIVLAAADPLPPTRLQELELLLGGPVRLHIALHHYLQRAMRATAELRQQRPEAAYLLGDEVAPESLADGEPSRVAVVVPPTILPTWRQTRPPRPCAVVATVQQDRFESARRLLDQAGLRVVLAMDGASALQSIARESPVLIVVEARLPGRSGADIMARLADGERFRSCTKLLVVDPGLAIEPVRFAAMANFRLTPMPDLARDLDALVSRVGRGDPARDAADRARAQAELCSGQALCQDNDLGAAEERFRAALRHDPLSAEAHRELARLCAGRGALVEARERFALAADLGLCAAEEVAALAEVTQALGDLVEAAGLWRHAARLTTDPQVAQILAAHGDSLGVSPADAGP